MTRTVLALLGLVALTAGAAAQSFWVVGNQSTRRCDIVTNNPTIGGGSPDFFGDGRYKSKDDAKLAMRTIKVCPPYQDPDEKKKAPAKKSGGK